MAVERYLLPPEGADWRALAATFGTALLAELREGFRDAPAAPARQKRIGTRRS